MDEFESLLEKERISAERYVRFRLNDPAEADDVLQDIYLTAFQKFSALRKKESFKAWLIAISRNKVNDYFRKKAVRYEIPKALLGLPEQGGFALDFKWADGVNADHTVEDFYLNGDTAPYGRLCFRYRSGQPEQ